MVVKLGLNGQGLLMEVPDLSLSSISSLDDHVSVVDEIKISVCWQFRDDVEWSFNIESEHLVEFSLLWIFWHFVSVDDIPLLVESLMFVPDDDVSVFSIYSSGYIQDLAFIVNNISTLISEQLPPS